ncbi:MAG: hypothetical protein RL685_6400 [Pseudomonadota bacterium]|jgi:hypothetical protein
MSTDDRDIESSNPSKNFKVGDFDQRSGFFTPVWESKRRIRSEPPEPPAPPSSKGASSQGSGSEAGHSSQAGQGQAGQSQPASSQAGDAEVAWAQDASATSKSSKGAPRPRSSGGSKTRRSGAARNTPAPPSTSEGAAAAAGSVLLPPAVAAVFDPSVQLDGDGASSAHVEAPASAESASAAVPASSSASKLTEQPAGSEASARPSAAARALRDAGPDLPPAAFLDAEPEFRAPRPSSARDSLGQNPAGPEERTDRSPAHHRSLRATSAAARVHDQLKAKLQAEAAEIDESRYDQAPDSQPILQAQEQEYDPYPQSLLRRLRRTIRLSAPVPDRIRSLISKYDRG